MALESAFCDFFTGENPQAKRNLKIKNKYIFLSSLKTGTYFKKFLLSNGVSVFEKFIFDQDKIQLFRVFELEILAGKMTNSIAKKVTTGTFTF